MNGSQKALFQYPVNHVLMWFPPSGGGQAYLLQREETIAI